jgi:hypothetical protein
LVLVWFWFGFGLVFTPNYQKVGWFGLLFLKQPTQTT